MITSQNQSDHIQLSLVLSSRKRRIAAFVIDHFILSFTIVSCIFIILGTHFFDGDNALFTKKMTFCLPIGLVFYFAKDSFNGISVGRWIMGIMVRKSENYAEVPSVVSLFLRNVTLIIWPIEFIVMAANDNKKRLGDRITNTVVLRNPTRQSALPKVLTLVAFAIAFVTFMIVFSATAMKGSEAYKVAIQEIEKDQSILNETGGIVDYGMMPSGTISISNGSGKATLRITVIGKNKEVTVNAYLVKERQGIWKLVTLSR